MTWYLYLSLIKLKIRISPCQVKLLEWLAKKSVRLYHGHRLNLRHMLLKINDYLDVKKKSEVHLAPSLIQYRTTFGFCFSGSRYEAELAPLLYAKDPDESFTVDALLNKRSLDNPSLGMRFPMLLFSSHESNFFTIFTLFCLSLVDRNV